MKNGFFVFFCLICCSSCAVLPSSPKAKDGIIDLRGWDFKNNGPVRLDGMWEFYHQKLLTNTILGIQSDGFFPVPSQWNSFNISNRNIGGLTYGTFILKVLIPGKLQHLSFYNTDIGTSFRIFVNGALISESGVPGTNRNTTVAFYKPQIGEFTSQTNVLNVAVQVANFQHISGGIRISILMGTETILRNIWDASTGLEYFLIGALVLVLFYHLFIFIIRRNEMASFYLSLLCLLLIDRTVLSGQHLFSSWFPWVSFEIREKLSYLGTYLSLTPLYLFSAALFPTAKIKPLEWVFIAYAVVMTVIVIFTPVIIFSTFLLPVEGMMLLSMFFSFVVFIRAIKQRQSGAAITMTGFLIFFLSVVNDLLYSQQIINTAYISTTGLLGFMFFESFLLSINYAKALGKSEAMGKKLEKLVDERTKDIQMINRELEIEISERIIAQERTLSEKERLLVTIRSLTEGFISTDIDSQIILLNPAAEEMIETSMENSLGKPIQSIIQFRHDKDHTPINPTELVLTTGKTIVVKSALLVNNLGYEFLVEASVSPVIDAGQALIGTVMVFRDIQTRKKTEEYLIKSIKLESVRTLSGGIAHDFNNILTGILGNISLAKYMLKPDDKIYSLMLDAEKASMRAKGLSQQLLALSKGGILFKQATQLADLIYDATRFVLSGVSFETEFSIPDNIWIVEIDRGQIAQVIHNLILNAREAMPNGGQLRIECCNTTLDSSNRKIPLPDGNYVRVSVIDTGTGISKQNLPKIFDPYYTTKGEGQGLGLATSFTIVRNHNGYITVDSVEGKGSTFTFYLPTVQESRKLGPVQSLNKNSGSVRILVIEDEENIRAILRVLFTSHDWLADYCASGQEGLTYFQRALEDNKPYDLVFLDLTLPGELDGRETFQSIKNLDPYVKAVITSGYTEDPVILNFKQYGFSMAITKPFRISDLEKTLLTLLNSADEGSKK